MGSSFLIFLRLLFLFMLGVLIAREYGADARGYLALVASWVLLSGNFGSISYGQIELHENDIVNINSRLANIVCCSLIYCLGFIFIFTNLDPKLVVADLLPFCICNVISEIVKRYSYREGNILRYQFDITIGVLIYAVVAGLSIKNFEISVSLLCWGMALQFILVIWRFFSTKSFIFRQWLRPDILGGFRFFLSDLPRLPIGKIDVILLSFAVSTSEIGRLTAAFSITQVIRIFFSARIMHSREDFHKRDYSSVSETVFLLLFSVCVISICFSFEPELLAYIYGDDFRDLAEVFYLSLFSVFCLIVIEFTFAFLEVKFQFAPKVIKISWMVSFFYLLGFLVALYGLNLGIFSIGIAAASSLIFLSLAMIRIIHQTAD